MCRHGDARTRHAAANQPYPINKPVGLVEAALGHQRRAACQPGPAALLRRSWEIARVAAAAYAAAAAAAAAGSGVPTAATADVAQSSTQTDAGVISHDLKQTE